MPSFAQTHARVTTYYQLQENVDLQEQLMAAARWKKPVLIIPALATEFTEPENLPVFENIIEQLAKCRYLAHVIFGLDQATQDEVSYCIDLLKKAGLTNYVIQWNDGPSISGIYNTLGEAGVDLSQRGKGRNVFMDSGWPRRWAPPWWGFWTRTSGPSAWGS